MRVTVPDVNALTKDIGTVYTSFFEHRPFLINEMKFLIAEFEQRRGDLDLRCIQSLQDKLLSANQTLATCREHQLDIEGVNEKLKDTIAFLTNKLALESEYETNRKEEIDRVIALEEQKRKEFQDDTEVLLKEIDTRYENQIEMLVKKQYELEI